MFLCTVSVCDYRFTGKCLTFSALGNEAHVFAE